MNSGYFLLNKEFIKVMDEKFNKISIYAEMNKAVNRSGTQRVLENIEVRQNAPEFVENCNCGKPLCIKFVYAP